MNQHQARQQQIAAARLEFMQALSRGQVHVVDRMGNSLKPGDRVLWHPTVDPMVEIQAVQPNMDPEAPIGQMLITIAVTLPIAVAPNTALQNFVLMGSVAAQPATTASRELTADETTDAVSKAAGDVAARIADNEAAGRDMEPERKSGPTGLVDGTGRSLDEPPL